MVWRILLTRILKSKSTFCLGSVNKRGIQKIHSKHPAKRPPRLGSFGAPVPGFSPVLIVPSWGWGITPRSSASRDGVTHYSYGEGLYSPKIQGDLFLSVSLFGSILKTQYVNQKQIAVLGVS